MLANTFLLLSITYKVCGPADQISVPPVLKPRNVTVNGEVVVKFWYIRPCEPPVSYCSWINWQGPDHTIVTVTSDLSWLGGFDWVFTEFGDAAAEETTHGTVVVVAGIVVVVGVFAGVVVGVTTVVVVVVVATGAAVVVLTAIVDIVVGTGGKVAAGFFCADSTRVMSPSACVNVSVMRIPLMDTATGACPGIHPPGSAASVFDTFRDCDAPSEPAPEHVNRCSLTPGSPGTGTAR